MPSDDDEGTPVNSSTRWEALYEQLHSDIDHGTMPQGSRVPAERELMERFGVSRNTVRAAIGRLEQ